MKKILLGLILSTGVSGFSFANNNINLDFGSSELEMVDCTYAFHLLTIDCDGNKTVSRAGGNAGDCGANADNSLIIKVKINRVCTPEVNEAAAIKQVADAINF